MVDNRPRCSRTGKIRFASSAAAAKEIRKAQHKREAGQFREGKEGRVEARSYPCIACGGHHLTADGAPPPLTLDDTMKPKNGRHRGR